MSAEPVDREGESEPLDGAGDPAPECELTLVADAVEVDAGGAFSADEQQREEVCAYDEMSFAKPADYSENAF